MALTNRPRKATRASGTVESPAALTNKQRHEYADMLAIGVPEAAIVEWCRTLDAYIAAWTRDVRKVLARKATGSNVEAQQKVRRAR